MFSTKRFRKGVWRNSAHIIQSYRPIHLVRTAAAAASYCSSFAKPLKIADRAAYSRELWSLIFWIAEPFAHLSNLSKHQIQQNAFRPKLHGHAVLAEQVCHLSSHLHKVLKEAHAKNPGNIPYSHTLASAVELLHYYYKTTAALDHDLISESLLNNDDRCTWEQWRNFRNEIKLAADALEAFLPPNWISKLPRAGTIPLESFLELSIQCFLDAIPNRVSPPISIDQVQESLQRAFPFYTQPSSPFTPPTQKPLGYPSAKKWFAAPPLVCLSATTYGGYHISGNSQRFDLDRPPKAILQKLPRNAWKNVFGVGKLFAYRRKAVLKEISGSNLLEETAAKLVEIKTSKLQHMCNKIQSPSRRHFECIESNEIPSIKKMLAESLPLFGGRRGQAMLTHNWENKRQCVKCHFTHGFLDDKVSGEWDPRLFPTLSCGEDMWVLKSMIANLEKDEYVTSDLETQIYFTILRKFWGRSLEDIMAQVIAR